MSCTANALQWSYLLYRIHKPYLKKYSLHFNKLNKVKYEEINIVIRLHTHIKKVIFPKSFMRFIFSGRSIVLLYDNTLKT